MKEKIEKKNLTEKLKYYFVGWVTDSGTSSRSKVSLLRVLSRESAWARSLRPPLPPVVEECNDISRCRCADDRAVTGDGMSVLKRLCCFIRPITGRFRGRSEPGRRLEPSKNNSTLQTFIIQNHSLLLRCQCGMQICRKSMELQRHISKFTFSFCLVVYFKIFFIFWWFYFNYSSCAILLLCKSWHITQKWPFLHPFSSTCRRFFQVMVSSKGSM